MQGVVTQVDRLCSCLALHAAPGLTPQPLLGQAVNGNLVLDEVRQVLVEIGEGIRVLGKAVVHPSEDVSHTSFSE